MCAACVAAHATGSIRADTQSLGLCDITGRCLLYILSSPAHFHSSFSHQNHLKTWLREREREVEKESKRFGAMSRVLEHFRDQLLYRKSEEIVQKLEEAMSEFRTVHSSPFEMSALGFGSALSNRQAARTL